MFNGPATITPVVLFDLLGHRLRNLIRWLCSIRMFNKSIATRLDVDLATLLTLTEEIRIQLTEALTLVKLLSKFLLLFQMELGLFNGPGLVELSRWVIIFLA